MPDPLHNLIGQVTMTLVPGTPTSLAFPYDNEGVAFQPHQARISVEGNPCRWGSNPSAISGQWVGITPPNNVVYFDNPALDYSAQLKQVKFLALSGPATLQINYMD